MCDKGNHVFQLWVQIGQDWTMLGFFDSAESAKAKAEGFKFHIVRVSHVLSCG